MAPQLLLSCVLTFSFMLTMAGPPAAQERFGGITGIVTDESAGVLPGATVVLTNRATGRVVRLVTDTAGAYRAFDLEPGRYSVLVELPGFARREIPAITVILGKTIDVSVTLTIGRLSEEVQVTAQVSPLVDLRATTVAHNVAAEEIDLLPKTRNFLSIAVTSPSVNAGVIEDGFQVNGASGAENAFTVDGVVTSSLFNGRSRQETVFEYVQEVQVKTAGISAEYGGAMGGVVSAVTRSGGNTFHGEGHYYFDSSSISASPVRRLVLSPVDDKTVVYAQDRKQPDRRHEPGGSVGGPFVRDRTFFFGSVSPRYVDRTNSYLFSNGTEPGTIAQTQTFMQAFGKISYARRRVNAYGSALYTPTIRLAHSRPTTAPCPKAFPARGRATPPTRTADSVPRKRALRATWTSRCRTTRS